ncbi:hypothetical protein [Marinobacter caseinilyticus]|uniref:hypothetical protein n=1 Tax=Marinobacter caseinilyticus TaxID=2692195 RepID=UPI00140E5BB0|nr:hypothetical protein [Marinobacter caseinilyticus]
MPEPTLEEKVSALSRPRAYPVDAVSIESIETHWSWVFLTPEHVYKLKKPVTTDCLDFSQLEKRHHNCLEECRLNRRLAESVYLGVVPLVRNSAGELRIEDHGETVDWLVHMRRLPRDLMLNEMMRRGRIPPDKLSPALSRLCNFYLEAQPVAMSQAVWIKRFSDGIANNQRCLLDPRYRLDPEQVSHIMLAQKTFLGEYSDLLQQRLADNRVIEAHGDLRPEHVCLTDPPVIIDCLEFDRTLRLLDPVDELAYFRIECEAARAPEVGLYFFEQYQKQTHDCASLPLSWFYLAYRASTRARLAAMHLLDDPDQKRRNWLAEATTYLRLARHYTRWTTR